MCAHDKTNLSQSSESGSLRKAMHNRTITSETGTRHHMTSSLTLISYQKLLCRRQISWPRVPLILKYLVSANTHATTMSVCPSALAYSQPVWTRCFYHFNSQYFSRPHLLVLRDLFFSPSPKKFLFHFNCTRSILLEVVDGTFTHARPPGPVNWQIANRRWC